ncbi:MAG: hypothetical protein IVW53_02095 [Chloroflexi bacterium]|nr:hypothetical protein [Chloroflexota bacterium]
MELRDNSWRRVVTLALRGSRFDGSLRISDLEELEAFQALLTELAGSLWRKGNPTRIRLPKGFETATQLRFDHVDVGSSAVPLEARTTQAMQGALFDSEEDRDAIYASVIAAVDLASRSVIAASRGERLPDDLPATSIRRLGSLGTTLGSAEELSIRPERWDDTAGVPVVSGEVRDRIAALVPGRYEDEINVTGHVMAADVANGRFVLHDHDGRELPGTFNSAQERQITTALRDHDSLTVEIAGRAIYEASGQPFRVALVTRIRTVGIDEPGPEDSRTLWAALADLGRTKSIEGLPADASELLDDYLYGDPH